MSYLEIIEGYPNSSADMTLSELMRHVLDRASSLLPEFADLDFEEKIELADRRISESPIRLLRDRDTMVVFVNALLCAFVKKESLVLAIDLVLDKLEDEMDTEVEDA